MPCRIYKLDFQEGTGSNFSLENLINNTLVKTFQLYGFETWPIR